MHVKIGSFDSVLKVLSFSILYASSQSDTISISFKNLYLLVPLQNDWTQDPKVFDTPVVFLKIFF